jgi:polyhydroxybutyrate depolymerase
MDLTSGRLPRLFVVCLLVAGCGSSGPTASSAPGAATPSTSQSRSAPTAANPTASATTPTVTPNPTATATPAATATRAAARTPLPTIAPSVAICTPSSAKGDVDLTIRAETTPRHVLIHVPSGFRAPMPAVIALHGYGGLALETGSHTELTKKADAAGFVGVYPQGLSGEWAVPGYPSAPVLDATDRALFTTILDLLAASGCIDINRVYVAGHSQGGGMASFLACAYATRLAGAALVSGEFFQPPCEPERRIPVVLFHALDDPILPYGGGAVAGTSSTFPHVLSVESFASAWARRDGCSGEPARQPLKGGVLRLSWQNCAQPVVLYRLPTGGHDWPGSLYYPGSNRDINADDVMWSFFQDAAPLP